MLADTGPRALFHGLVGTEHLPARFLAGLRRFRYGTGVFKVDLALDGPAPWAAPELAETGVVHLTGDLDAMAQAAHEARRGIVPARSPCSSWASRPWPTPAGPRPGATRCGSRPTSPPCRATAGRGRVSKDAFLDVVMDRLEDHAPGLRAKVVGSAVRTPEDLEQENPNLVGGDLGAGSSSLDQQLVFRPVPGWFRYAHPGEGPLPVLGLDPSRRGRPRHGRAQLRPAGAVGPAPAPDLTGPPPATPGHPGPHGRHTGWHPHVAGGAHP